MHHHCAVLWDHLGCEVVVCGWLLQKFQSRDRSRACNSAARQENLWIHGGQPKGIKIVVFVFVVTGDSQRALVLPGSLAKEHLLNWPTD